MPITETRFKKKKLETEETDKDKSFSTRASAAHDPRREIGVLGTSFIYIPHPHIFRGNALFLCNMAGVTSPTHLLHSQATISSRVYQGYDARYNHTFEVSKTGDGLISVQKPSNEEQQTKPVEYRVERNLIEQLINAYFTDVAPLLPVVTQVEFLAHSSPPPILLYSMCLVAAARRDVPQQVFDSIRYTVNSIIKAEDVLSTASIVNVQALLILCMTGDCHSPFVPTALSALWIRLGTAIRMVIVSIQPIRIVSHGNYKAQDLGLHRCESVQQNVELRRRLWGACLISDRWYRFFSN